MNKTNFYLVSTLIFVLAIGIALGVYKDKIVQEIRITSADAAKDKKPTFSPVKALSDRDVYYPGTEDLKPDEMRIVACGTGPDASRIISPVPSALYDVTHPPSINLR